MTKRPGATSDNGFIFKTINQKRKDRKKPVGGFENDPIYPLLSTWISTWTEPEVL